VKGQKRERKDGVKEQGRGEGEDRHWEGGLRGGDKSENGRGEGGGRGSKEEGSLSRIRVVAKRSREHVREGSAGRKDCVRATGGGNHLFEKLVARKGLLQRGGEGGCGGWGGGGGDGGGRGCARGGGFQHWDTITVGKFGEKTFGDGGLAQEGVSFDVPQSRPGFLRK